MRRQQNIKKEIKAIRKLFKNSRDTFSRNESSKIRTKLYKKGIIHDFLKSRPELTDDEARVFKRIPKYLQKIRTDLSKHGNYQENYLYAVEHYLMKMFITSLLR